MKWFFVDFPLQSFSCMCFNIESQLPKAKRSSPKKVVDLALHTGKYFVHQSLHVRLCFQEYFHANYTKNTFYFTETKYYSHKDFLSDLKKSQDLDLRGSSTVVSEGLQEVERRSISMSKLRRIVNHFPLEKSLIWT